MNLSWAGEVVCVKVDDGESWCGGVAGDVLGRVDVGAVTGPGKGVVGADLRLHAICMPFCKIMVFVVSSDGPVDCSLAETSRLCGRLSLHRGAIHKAVAWGHMAKCVL